MERQARDATTAFFFERRNLKSVLREVGQRNGKAGRSSYLEK